jgi:hypothetical protein
MEDEGYKNCLECGEDVTFGGGHRNAGEWLGYLGLPS